jgi:1,4-alpha-glucan branching enzyme
MGGEIAKQTSLGAHAHADGGVSFRVWAPFADSVSVTGDFNNWSERDTPLARQDGGYWSIDVPDAKVGQEYKYAIMHEGQRLLRNDPCALQLTSSGDNSVIEDSGFDWGEDAYKLPSREELIIYELHVGTFVRDDPAMPGTFQLAMTKLDYLKDLGVNAIEIMPCNASWMDRWWGYTPDNIYAVEAAYGGRRAFMAFVRAAHQKGMGVILDVVYNHFSQDPGLDLWQFDGWSQDGKGGIYFYNDWRSHTPWGEGRPDYGRPEVRRFITDNARMWLRDCHVDGLRVDATWFIRMAGKGAFPDQDLPDGWKLLQEVTDVAYKTKPDSLTIAEDLQGNKWITKPVGDGGAGFGAQWDSSFAAILREVLGPPADESRDLQKIRFALSSRTNDSPFERIIYSESHDTDAKENGGTRLDESIDPGNAGGFYARKRAAIAAAMLMTAPGTPMIFQGQEFQEDGAFNHYRPLDWSKAERFEGILKLYQHLTALRLNHYDNTAGLLGKNCDVFHTDNNNKVLGYHRWDKAGKGDDVVVLVNLSNKAQEKYRLVFPATGTWWVRLNTDWKGYSDDFTDQAFTSVDVAPDPSDPQKFVGEVEIAPYAVLIFSQDL